MSSAAVLAVTLRIVAAELAVVTRGAQAWAESERARVVDDLDFTSRSLTAAKAPILVAQEEAGAWRKPGVRSFEAHLAAKGREDLGPAKREAQAARTLTAIEGGLDAAARGEFTGSHAQKLAAALDTADPHVREALQTGEGAELVLELARDLDPKKFGRKVEELVAAQHPATVQDAHEAIRAQRYLRIMPGPNGTKVEGFLDPVSGQRVLLAIEAASPRPGSEDTRTLGQRNADALDTIAGVILAESPATRGLDAATLVTITMSETTFLDAKAHLENATHTRTPATGASENSKCETNDIVENFAVFPTIRIVDGPLVPPADLGRLICGSKVSRMVIDACGEPLNVGRTPRLFTGARRRAVEARDQHCAWPQCRQAARYCEIHHLDWWDHDHGETDTRRGILVCSFHHHELHRHDLDLVKIDLVKKAPGDQCANPTQATSPSPNPLDANSPRGSSPGGVRPGGRRPAGRHPKPGDRDYEPPRYELVPRARTADERRTRLSERLRRDARTRRSA